jgi:hypothetical protein
MAARQQTHADDSSEEESLPDRHHPRMLHNDARYRHLCVVRLAVVTITIGVGL